MVRKRLILGLGLLLVLILVVAGAILVPRYFTAVNGVAPTTTDRAEPTEDPAMAARRERMVLDTIVRRGVRDEDVVEAMRNVPRHAFVPEADQAHAYGDHPLPIGFGQTISQPYIVALMTELLALEQGDKVLEIGTGSGYQAAVLAAIPGVEVYTIEIIPDLADRAEATLNRLGYEKVYAKQGDGYYGWPEKAPFDAIIVTAAPDHVPQPLVDQLAPNGVLVIPVGPPGGYQTLWRFVRQPDGEVKAYNEGGVAFVPFTGEGIRQSPEDDLLP